jgi:hypothetical protein
VADSLYAVAIRIDDEGGIIARMVFGPETWRAIVLPSCGESGGVKAIDRRRGPRAESDVGTRALSAISIPDDREIVASLPQPVSGGFGLIVESREAQSRQDDIIERLRAFEIANAERHVIDDLRQSRLHHPSLSFVTTYACLALARMGWDDTRRGRGAVARHLDDRAGDDEGGAQRLAPAEGLVKKQGSRTDAQDGTREPRSLSTSRIQCAAGA